MKRIISLLLACILIFSLAACGKKEEVVLVPIPSDPPITEPAPTEPPVVETEPPVIETEPVVDITAEKNEYWAQVLANNEFVLDLSSAYMRSDKFEVGALNDPAGNLSATAAVIGDGTMHRLAIYQIGENYYCNEFKKDNEEATDVWYNITADETLAEFDPTTVFMGSPESVLSSLQSVEYSHTEEDLDYLNATYFNPLLYTFQEGAVQTTIYDADLEFELNGEIGEFSYQVITYPESGGIGNSQNTTWALNVFDEGATFDEDTLTLTLGDGTEIICVEKEVRVAKADVDPVQLPTQTPVEFTMIANPANNTIEYFEIELSGAKTTYMTMIGEDLTGYIPADIADMETITSEDFTTKLGEVIFAMIFASL